MFAILRIRGTGDLKSGQRETKATDRIVGWTLARTGKSVPDTKTGSLKDLLDLDPESRNLFGPLLDGLDKSEKRLRNIPEWLAVGAGFETEDELRSFLENEVGTIRVNSED
jgi:hypothetical protein